MTVFVSKFQPVNDAAAAVIDNFFETRQDLQKCGNYVTIASVNEKKTGMCATFTSLKQDYLGLIEVMYEWEFDPEDSRKILFNKEAPIIKV